MNDGDVSDAGASANREIVGRGADELRWDERLSSAFGSFWRRHARPIVAVVLIIGLVGGSAYGWVRAHPAPLAVPELAVRAAGVSAIGLTDSIPGDIVRGSLRLRLDLTVTAGNTADESIHFRGLSGAGMAPLYPEDVALAAAGETGLESRTRIDCGQWAGFDGVVAHFRLAGDGRTRDVEIPVNPVTEAAVSTAIQRPCAVYNQTHPLRVVSVTETLDPVLPIIHLTWSIRNPTDTSYTIFGSSSGSMGAVGSDVSPVFEAGVPTTGQSVPSHGTATVRTALAVRDCDTPEPITLVDQYFALNGEIDRVSRDPNLPALEVDLPDEPTIQAEALARQACAGAPHVQTGGVDVVSRAKGNRTEVTATVVGNLLSRNGSSAPSLPSQVWITSEQSYVTGLGSVPFGNARVAVAADGHFSIQATWVPDGCDPSTTFETDSTLHLVVRAAREYPYLVGVTSSTISSICIS